MDKVQLLHRTFPTEGKHFWLVYSSVHQITRSPVFHGELFPSVYITLASKHPCKIGDSPFSASAQWGGVIVKRTLHNLLLAGLRNPLGLRGFLKLVSAFRKQWQTTENNNCLAKRGQLSKGGCDCNILLSSVSPGFSCLGLYATVNICECISQVEATLNYYKQKTVPRK